MKISFLYLNNYSTAVDFILFQKLLMIFQMVMMFSICWYSLFCWQL